MEDADDGRAGAVRFDGEELMIATTAAHLRKALRFATRVIGVPAYFVMSGQKSSG